LKFKCKCGGDKYKLTETASYASVSVEPEQCSWDINIPEEYCGYAECLSCNDFWVSHKSIDHLQEVMIDAGGVKVTFKCPRCSCGQFVLTHRMFEVLQTNKLFDFNAVTWQSITEPDEYSLQCAGCKIYWSIQPTIEEIKAECINIGVLK